MTTRIIVIGHGMVGSRFVEELTRRDHDHEFVITVLGAEEYEPYNRVLLSEVVAGAIGVAALSLPTTDRHGVQVLRGVTAVRIDRGRRVVLDDHGNSHPYDRVVLATGSRSRIPDLPGLVSADHPSESLPAGVHPMRTLDDAREIVAASVNAERAVVLGAGVLGLEVACGLARRGLEVMIIHARGTPMDRQLSPEAGGTLAGSLDRLGIRSRLSSGIEQVDLTAGHLTHLRPAGGETMPCDLLVLTCGTLPEAGIAAAAGLSVDRGVLVTDDFVSPDDDRIIAIGDCAQPPDGASGLVAQGWDQARHVAAALTRRPTDAPTTRQQTARRDVVRVKAHGLEIVTMGSSVDQHTEGHRRVRLSDPDLGRHLEVIVADGLLVGAICLGSPAVGADLVAAFTRGTPVPADPAQLLLRSLTPAATAAPSPTHIPDRATICNCNGVSKADIVKSWRNGARSVPDVAQRTRATTGCGTCTDAVCGIVDWLRSVDPEQPADDPSHSRPPPGEDGVTRGKPHLHTAEIAAG